MRAPSAQDGRFRAEAARESVKTRSRARMKSRLRSLIDGDGARLLPPLAPGEALLLLLQAPALGPEDEAQLRDRVQHDERIRCDGYRRDEDRQVFLIGRALLRRALGESLGVAASSIALVETASGKPERIGGDRPWFNLSHSRGTIALALSLDGRIGVDVEHAIPGRAAPGAAATHFAPVERAALEACAVEHHALLFFRLWTLKEAYLKARGEGMPFGLQAFGFECGGDAIHFHPPPGEVGRWRFDQGLVFGDRLWATAREVTALPPAADPRILVLE